MNKEVKTPDVPYIVHEAEVARQERCFKRLWIIILMLLVLLVATNGAWIWRESQFEDIAVTQDVDTGDGAAIIAGVGDINYGESKTDG